MDKPDHQKIRFSIMGDEFVSCSKKCKKVTKFAYMLRQNNEQEILRAFESMLRKKLKKGAQANAMTSSTNSKVPNNLTQSLVNAQKMSSSLFVRS